ncbi:EamA-like transporter family protein [Methylobacillus rhizosphaerae]|uniref:EamA-like transporter family protein n=1 Tax=Methylobacillus rhizosphaerae TaxID=551994 RepID=A0A238ZY39_9PROT|nr:EamA-like transporter family protein [Methylobacillus rhizosphaerae]
MHFSRQHILIGLALFALYFIWGSTYLAMRIAIESLPPFMMAAIRFIVAGGVLYLWLRWRGKPAPTLRQWGGASLVGLFLLVIGNGGVAYAEQTVSSGVAALAVATMPLWAAVFSRIWGYAPSSREWLGILLGTVGVVVLNLGAEMRASPLGAMVLLLASASWAFGSLLGKHLPMPQGVMASAAQMLCGGVMLLGASWMHHEAIPQTIEPAAIYAVLYLIVFGSLIAYSAYLFLYNAVRPALATSYAFVNPLVAMILGAWLAGEALGHAEFYALVLIMLAVVLVLPLGRRR